MIITKQAGHFSGFGRYSARNQMRGLPRAEELLVVKIGGCGDADAVSEQRVELSRRLQPAGRWRHGRQDQPKVDLAGGAGLDHRELLAAVTLETPPDRDHVSSFLNIRVADIYAVYEQWRARGAEFLTTPPTSPPWKPTSAAGSTSGASGGASPNSPPSRRARERWFTVAEAVAYDMAGEVIGGPAGAPESGTPP
jgi:hypothetical protein